MRNSPLVTTPAVLSAAHARRFINHSFPGYLPNTPNPDDWAKISGKKGGRIVYIRTVLHKTDSADAVGGRAIERAATGQYL